MAYIKKISLKNIKGFTSLDLDLTRADGSYPGWSVFAGINGSGKTSLLQAICLAFYGESLGMISHTQWLKKDCEYGQVLLELEPSKQDYKNPPGSLRCEFGWSDYGRMTSDMRTISTDNGDDDPDQFKGGNGWFLAGYGPFRRLSGSSAEMQNWDSPIMERVATLFHEGAALPEAVDWLKTINYKKLEKIISIQSSDKKDIKSDEEQLEEDVLLLLNDGLFPEGVKISRVSSKGLYIRQNDKDLLLTQLSDGYRATLTMVLDIVKNMENAFGKFYLEKNGETITIPFEGVVLIDEIDAHLHISWQKKIGIWFKEHFPNIQFLVTTHSPFICQAASPDGLFILPSLVSKEKARKISGEQYYDIINGSVEQAAVTELFGLEYTHSKSSEISRIELAQLEGKMIRNKANQKDLERRKALLEILPKGGSSDINRAIRGLNEAWK